MKLHRREHQPHADRLLIFFTGWGMDESVTAHLEPGAFDLWTVSDYTEPVTLEIPSHYRERCLIAWSLGVWAAAESGIAVDSALAINGTLRPIDAESGIAPEIFEGTIANWQEERARERFLLRMTGSRAALETFPRPARTPESQRAELRALSDRIGVRQTTYRFDRAVIGTRDKIFPAEAQRHFWSSIGVPATEVDAPHTFFDRFKTWDEVIHIGENR